MSRLGRRYSWLTLVAVGVLVTSVFATQRAIADTGDEIARLEALLDSQQQRIDSLQQQVSAASAQDDDAARADAVRQQIREILGEQEFRESLMPSMLQAGYDKGFFIRSSDDNFKLKINGYMQFRWTHYDTKARNHYLMPRFERNDRTGFDIQRMRLILQGHAFTPDLYYHIQLNSDSARGYNTSIHWAFMNYRFSDEFQVRWGIFKAASTRSQLMAEWGFQFPDRPMMEAVFGNTNSVGVRFWGHLFDKKLTYMFDVLNSLNTTANRTITTDPPEMDNNPALLFRVVWHALGDDLKEWVFEGDVNRNESPLLDIGFHYAFNEDEGDTRTVILPFPRQTPLPGGFGRTTTNGMQTNQFGLDAAFKYQGFSAMAEYEVRFVDPRRAGRTPFTPWWLLTGDDSTTGQHGGLVQLGYFLPIPGMEDKFEAVARVDFISALAEEQEYAWEYGLGLNYYLQGAAAGHKSKLQFDITKVPEVPTANAYSSLANVNDDALIFRVQLQVGF